MLGGSHGSAMVKVGHTEQRLVLVLYSAIVRGQSSNCIVRLLEGSHGSALVRVSHMEQRSVSVLYGAIVRGLTWVSSGQGRPYRTEVSLSTVLYNSLCY